MRALATTITAAATSVLFLALAVPAFGQDEVTVDSVTGYGTSLAGAQDDALRKAVEQGAGMLIKSKSKTENFVLVSDQVYSESRGFVSSFKELSKQKNPDGTWQVTISAVVSKKLIESKVAQYEMLMDRVGRPKIMILMKTVRNGAVKKTTEVEQAVQMPFLEAQFEMVDAEQLAANKKRALNVAVLEDNQGAMVDIAREVGADVLIRGHAIIQDEPGSRPYLHKVNMNMTLRAIRVSNAILLANSVENYIGRKASLRDTPISIFGRTAKIVGVKTGKILRMKMMKKWAFEQQNRIVVELVLHDAEFADGDMLSEWLEEQDWVKSVGETRLDAGKLRMTITAKLGRASSIASKISRGFRKGTAPIKVRFTKVEDKRLEGTVTARREE